MNVVEGLNKVDCYVTGHDGKTVTISNGTNTWSGVLASGHVVFMIPNMPAPAKSPYTCILHNGDASAAALYTKQIELGFGDSVKVPLFAGDQPVKQSQLDTTNTNVTNLTNTVNAKITYGTSDKVDGSSSLTTGTIYCYY